MHKHLKTSYLFGEPLVDPESRQYASTKIDNLVENHRFECPYYSAADISHQTEHRNVILPSKSNRKMKFSRIFGFRPIATGQSTNSSEESVKEKRGKQQISKKRFFLICYLEKSGAKPVLNLV